MILANKELKQRVSSPTRVTAYNRFTRAKIITNLNNFDHGRAQYCLHCLHFCPTSVYYLQKFSDMRIFGFLYLNACQRAERASACQRDERASVRQRWTRVCVPEMNAHLRRQRDGRASVCQRDERASVCQRDERASACQRYERASAAPTLSSMSEEILSRYWSRFPSCTSGPSQVGSRTLNNQSINTGLGSRSRLFLNPWSRSPFLNKSRSRSQSRSKKKQEPEPPIVYRLHSPAFLP